MPPPGAAIDPHDFTKWDLTNLPSIPLGEQQLDECNITSHRSWHAALLLVLMSDDIERLHPDVARTLHAGYQTKFLRPVDVADLKKYPSDGRRRSWGIYLRGGELVRRHLRLSSEPDGRR